MVKENGRGVKWYTRRYLFNIKEAIMEELWNKRCDIEKTNSKMVEVSPSLLVITLNVKD